MHRAPWVVLRGRYNESVGECTGKKVERDFIDARIALDILNSEIESPEFTEKKMFHKILS